MEVVRPYLLSRKQYVSVNCCQSSFLPVLPDVSQGSILGPLLFIIYVNDLPSLVQLSNVLLFADDTKCYKSFSSVSDSSLLQSDLDLLSDWCSDWNLRFNATKYNLLHFHMKSTSIISSNYCVSGSPVTTSACHKDLGIIVSDDLFWSSHYHYISSGAYKYLGVLRHTFCKSSSIYMKKLLYKTLVRSQLFYCSPVWRPYLVKDFKSLEKIQRRATKFILNDYTSDYYHHLITPNVLPLSMTYKLNDILSSPDHSKSSLLVYA